MTGSVVMGSVLYVTPWATHIPVNVFSKSKNVKIHNSKWLTKDPVLKKVGSFKITVRIRQLPF